MNAETLVPMNLWGAVKDRIEANSRLGQRREYLGASEVGNCLRHVTANKLMPEALDLESMGRMLSGRALENEVVQLVRTALNGRLRNTGRNQMEVEHPEFPFKAHPDGRIIGDTPDGDGVLEVKTASSAAFKRFQSEGLPQNYVDQVQAQMGLSGLSWALLVLVSRENLADLATFRIQFDAAHYSGLEERAHRWQEAVQGGSPFEDLDGEPTRGYCFTCPFNIDCPAYRDLRNSGVAGEIPDSVRLQLDCQLEELGQLEREVEPLEARVSELRAQIKDTLVSNALDKVLVQAGGAQMITSTRTSFDAKALQRDSPDIHRRYLKTSTYSNLRISFRGESA